jgi:16S rRNA processing protein RimM
MRAGNRTLTIRSLREHKGVLLVRFERVSSRPRADELRGLILEVPEDELGALPEGEYYRHELIGLEVIDSEGRGLGRLEEILETGANDVYVVRDAESELLVPAIEAVVKEVSLAGGRMIIQLMGGMERRPIKPLKAPARQQS